jgi:hypothetical protein
MNTAQKYSLCIVGGVLAEFAIYILILILPFTLSSIHIEVSQNFILSLSFPFINYVDLDTSLPLTIFLTFASLFQWPIYGWILGSGWTNHRLSKYAMVLAGFHIIAAIFAFWYSSKHPVDMWRGSRLG